MSGVGADVFAAVSDPARRAILDLLRDNERVVSDLLRSFSFSQPALSKHLRILREAGLVEQRKDGRLRWYRLNAARLREVASWVGRYERFWTERLDQLGTLLDEME